ncbi:hypothetical protein ACN27G_19690 [Plantactinospora sp. WMMB334]|uniref:hypothetical protein n=1 Tax=Plantactinospora sp. WMMB334 TaxID=3404119 RepID=UPI003B93FC38
MFHDSGLSLRCAQIGRVPCGLAPAWDRDRLSAETIALLRDHRDLVRELLVSAVLPFEEAPDLLMGLATGDRHETQAVLAT